MPLCEFLSFPTLKNSFSCLLDWHTQKRNWYIMVHLIRWACFFITLLLPLILIVPILYELQGSLWLRSIKVIGQCAFFMSFGWADSSGSSSLRRLGDQTPVAPTITSQSITQLGDRENSGGGSYVRTKHTPIWTEDTKSKVCVMSSWQYPCAWVCLKMGHIKQMSPNCGVVTRVLSWWPKWN